MLQFTQMFGVPAAAAAVASGRNSTAAAAAASSSGMSQRSLAVSVYCIQQLRCPLPCAKSKHLSCLPSRKAAEHSRDIVES